MNALESPCTVVSDLNDRAYEKCIPLNVSLELTLQCNIRCSHCYNFDRDTAGPVPGAQLSLEEIRPLLDELRGLGTLFLSLTGGEALVHPRFWDVMDEAAARAFAVQLLSNGTLLSDDLCDRLATYPNFWGASISVYGARPETHDGITGVRGSFRRTMEGSRRLAERGIGVGLKFILMKANAGEISGMMELADRSGLPYSIDPIITGRYDGTQGSLRTRVDHETIEALYRGPLRPFLKAGKSDPADDEFKCTCARGNAAVSATGDVYPCIATPLVAGNIRKERFTTIWRESPVFQWIRGLTLADFKSCAPCALKAWCHRSPGPAVVLHGDFTGVDPWICREAEILRDVQSGR